MKRLLGGVVVLLVVACGGGGAPTVAPRSSVSGVSSQAPGVSSAPVGNAQSVDGVDWSTTASRLRDQLGKHFVYACPPDGTVYQIWGTNTYTDDSSVCTAAVHRGLITVAAGGPVVIEIAQGAIYYLGTVKNGVSSDSYGDWGGSFIFVT